METGGVARVTEGGVEILPKFNTLVLFWADEMPHEVLPAWAPRCALTIWLNRGSTTEQLDAATAQVAEMLYDQMLHLVCPAKAVSSSLPEISTNEQGQ